MTPRIYYAGISSLYGEPVTHDSGLIAIIESPDNPVRIGVATNINKLWGNRVLYTLNVNEMAVQGNWFLEDEKFKRAE